MSTLGTYLDEIGRYPLLSAEEEIALARRIQRMVEINELDRPLTPEEKRSKRSGQRALDKFVRANLRWVVAIAKRYQGMCNCMDLMDLIQEGNAGLITAALRFDASRGYKFSTYSHWWIRQRITRGIRTMDRSLRLPGNISEMAYTWNLKYHRLHQELGRMPTHAELAEVHKVSEADVKLYLQRGQNPTSLSVYVGDRKDTELAELLADPRTLDPDEVLEQGFISDMRDQLNVALYQLEPAERQMVEQRWGLNGCEPRTYKEMGEEQGVTREAIRQRLDKAQRKLRLRLQRGAAAASKLPA